MYLDELIHLTFTEIEHLFDIWGNPVVPLPHDTFAYLD